MSCEEEILTHNYIMEYMYFKEDNVYITYIATYD